MAQPTLGTSNNCFHVRQATLAPGESSGRSILTCKVDDGVPIMLCSLREGAQESASLDLVYDRYTEFRVEGGAAIHLSGYYMPEYEGTSQTSKGLAAYGQGVCAQVASADLQLVSVGCLIHGSLMCRPVHILQFSSYPTIWALHLCKVKLCCEGNGSDVAFLASEALW
jgi:hypothetical protein